MDLLDFLQHDQALLTQLLTERHRVTMETLPFGVRTLWRIYLTILEDRLKTLASLIGYLAEKTHV